MKVEECSFNRGLFSSRINLTYSHWCSSNNYMKANIPSRNLSRVVTKNQQTPVNSLNSKTFIDKNMKFDKLI